MVNAGERRVGQAHRHEWRERERKRIGGSTSSVSTAMPYEGSMGRSGPKRQIAARLFGADICRPDTLHISQGRSNFSIRKLFTKRRHVCAVTSGICCQARLGNRKEILVAKPPSLPRRIQWRCRQLPVRHALAPIGLTLKRYAMAVRARPRIGGAAGVDERHIASIQRWMVNLPNCHIEKQGCDEERRTTHTPDDEFPPTTRSAPPCLEDPLRMLTSLPTSHPDSLRAKR